MIKLVNGVSRKLNIVMNAVVCKKIISDYSPVYGLNAKFRKDVETPPVEDEGYLIELTVQKSMDSVEYKPV